MVPPTPQSLLIPALQLPTPIPRPCVPIYLVGPTAVGKSAIALTLARLIGGEIISVDSMQVYRGMDIGTAKPSQAERTAVPHHLLDVVAVSVPFDTSQFLQLATPAMESIVARDKAPIFCGGTGLYFNASLHGLGNAPPSDLALRQQLEQTPLADLLRELEQADRVTYEQIDRQNPRRVVRAIEVIRLSGRPFSEQRASWERGSSDPQAASASGNRRIFGFTRSPKDLHQRIEARVEAMFQSGLVEETRQLLAAGLARNPTAMQALGYRQVVAHLEGTVSLEETKRLVVQKTRQFAKRQMTWFRRQFPVRWIELQPDTDPAAIAQEIVCSL